MINIGADFIPLLSNYWDTFMPAPHSVLLKGLTIGLDELALVPNFKQALVNTGTIHVAVVSGYNISLVINSSKAILGNRVSAYHAIAYIVVTLGYALFTGFEAPIVRAWLMSVICIITKLYGRVVPGVYVLFITCITMILCDVKLLESYSFLLSSGATLGLLLYGNAFQNMLNKCEKVPFKMLMTDLSSSLAATVVVSPFIAFSFSRISVFSPIFNMFLLWTIPISTVIGFMCVVITVIDITFNTEFCRLLFLFVFPFLDIFIKGINIFGKIPNISSEINVTKTQLLAYYALLSIMTVSLRYYFRVHKQRE